VLEILRGGTANREGRSKRSLALDTNPSSVSETMSLGVVVIVVEMEDELDGGQQKRLRLLEESEVDADRYRTLRETPNSSFLRHC
jgi:hypothetical protein